jgi:hypothetical protein
MEIAYEKFQNNKNFRELVKKWISIKQSCKLTFGPLEKKFFFH